MNGNKKSPILYGIIVVLVIAIIWTTVKIIFDRQEEPRETTPEQPRETTPEQETLIEGDCSEETLGDLNEDQTNSIFYIDNLVLENEDEEEILGDTTNAKCTKGEETYLSCNSKKGCSQYANLTGNKTTESDPKKVKKVVTTITYCNHIIKKEVAKTDDPKVFKVSFAYLKNENSKYKNDKGKFEYKISDSFTSNRSYLSYSLKEDNKDKISKSYYYVTLNNTTNGKIYYLDNITVGNTKVLNDVKVEYHCDAYGETPKPENPKPEEPKKQDTISLNKRNVELNIEQQYSIVATSSLGSKITYASSNTNVCTVNNNTVTAKQNGNCAINLTTANGGKETVNITVKTYGLVVKNGKITLDGKEPRMMGVNTFSLFSKHINSKETVSSQYKDEIDMLAKYEVPFIRLPICTWHPTYLKKYNPSDSSKVESSRKEYFQQIIDVVEYAESKNIGIIVDFFWLDEALPYYVGEGRSSMGDTNSKTMALAKQYVTDIVNLLKNYKAIWGWEIGNEYNLTVDLYPANGIGINPTYYIGKKKDAVNYFTTNEMVVFYNEISKTVRSIDKHRIITTGDAAIRVGAYSAYKKTKDIYSSNHKKWSPSLSSNSKSDIKTMLKKFNSGKM